MYEIARRLENITRWHVTKGGKLKGGGRKLSRVCA